MTETEPHRVAIVYHYFAHYREPIVRLLCSQGASAPQYELVSDFEADRPSLRTIDPEKAGLPLDEGGLPWRRVRNRWLIGPVLWQKGVIRLALSRKYDTIIFLGVCYYLSTWVAAILAKVTGKRVLMWSHGYIRKEKGILGAFRAAFYRLADAMLLYGNWARSIMLDRGFDSRRLYVIFNSLDYDVQKAKRLELSRDSLMETREKLFMHREDPILFFIGRLTPQKKLGMLLEAVSILHDQGQPVNLLFIGEGPEREKLQQEVQRRNLKDRVVFYGPCHSEDELAPLIASADLCVSPGEVGLTAMHSLAYGTPVVTHDDPENQMPEFEAIVDGKSGLFYPHGSQEGLAATIGEWLELAKKRGREQIRQDCYEVIDTCYNPHVQVRTINAAVLQECGAEELPLGESRFVRRRSRKGR